MSRHGVIQTRRLPPPEDARNLGECAAPGSTLGLMGAAPGSLAAGDRLSHFRIVAKIGEGGMGLVYLARDLHLERDVALKVLPPGAPADPDAGARFRREALALSRLSHPNIAVVHDFDTHEGRDFLVMEFVPGTTLADRLERGPLPEAEVIRIGVQLAAALDCAHQAGVLHRDLKPGNLRVTPDGRLKVLDFGLAKLLAPAERDVTRTLLSEVGTVVGTPAYMAPEQLRGGPVDERSDLYAAGAVLYEAVTGARPHPECQPAQLVDAVLHRAPASPRSLRPDLSRGLEHVLLRALAREPAARFGTACELRAALEAVAQPATRPQERSRAASRGASRPSHIVVIPFENLGPAEGAYFTSGMTEEITSRLAAAGGLRVISRTSALQYAGGAKSIREIAHELHVAFVLEGTVRWAPSGEGAGRVRISPRLVRARDETQLWVETYDRVLEDVFAVQSEIAQRVIRELGLTLHDAERRRIEMRPTSSLPAYQAYLRARHLASQPHFSVESWRDVIRNYEEAVALDPEFALAWAELARAHARFYYLKADHSRERRDLVAATLARAVELAPDAPEVHLAAAFHALWIEEDDGRTVEEIAAAERGLPDDPEILLARSAYLQVHGRWDEARDVTEHAFAISPRDTDVAAELAEIEWLTRRYPSAVAYCEKALTLAPDAGYRIWPNLYRVFIEWSWRGATPAARAAVEQVPREHEWWAMASFWQEMHEGRYREARDLAASLGEGWIRNKVWAMPASLLLAFACSALEDGAASRRGFEAAIEPLRRAAAEHPDDPRMHSSLGMACAGLGMADDGVAEAERAAQLLPMSRDAIYGIGPLQDLSVAYTLAGRTDQAVQLLERLLALPTWLSPVWLRCDPRYRPLAQHPRFVRLLGRG